MPATGSDEDPTGAVSAFVTGRSNYDLLVRRLKTYAMKSEHQFEQVVGVIRQSIEEGRLPNDLGTIVLQQLPGATKTSDAFSVADLGLPGTYPPTTPMAAASTAGTPNALLNDDFDEPTIPRVLHLQGMGQTPAAAPVPSPTISPLQVAGELGLSKGEAALTLTGHRDQTTGKPYLPPLPFLATPKSTSGDETRQKVDDVVLSSIVDDYRGFRKGRDGDAPETKAPEEQPEQLDKFLTNYRSARFRSDARRSGSDRSREAQNLEKFGAAGAPRAGVGSILRDRFILDVEIGRGGMGVVYSAVDRRRLEAGNAQPYVAVKLLNDEFRTNPDALRILEAEARKSQMLAHPNIASVYDFDRDRSEVFIVMELLKGVPLNRRLAQSVGLALPGNEASAILTGICSALTHAHSQGVIHSDLKPGNVFLVEDGPVKLLDFGLAAAATADGADETLADAMTTAYASPEMFDRAPRDPRDDIFALGCIAYQLISGTHPFAMRPSNEAAAENLEPEVLSDLDVAAWTAIRNALQFDRNKRTASVEDFMTALFDAPSED
ncbi:serine/threonine-protein kinase [Roseibium polysiphoniae]|uniref:Serine/threonine protein kinase n=1 Tax=Roseibium polysiphoniae TaxID=2571221 RepID=A0ABR9CA17_9HYPH|nr:serine/threonine-protein kinase [Roseibium polysiphoniae]MBD8876720.1 serine/threonine protein kinase [Roseibium polysiphoniae]